MDNERGPMDEIFFIGIPRDANAGLPPLVLMRFYVPRLSNVPQRLNEYIFTYIRPVRAEPTLELIWPPPPPRPPPGPQGGAPQQGFHPQQGEHRDHERERERERDRERENSRRDPEQEQERNRERQCKEEREESSHCSSVFP